MDPSFDARGQPGSGDDARGVTRREILALAALGLVAGAPGSAIAAGTEGQLIWGVHVSLAPIWFDPADVSGIITPFMVLYALHDAMVKLMPGQSPAPSLAEAWSASEDGLSYDFTLRQGAKFHNGEPVTAEDVKFSFERYRGTSHDLMMERVASVETPDPRHVRFKLKRPWPDFLTFYASATAAGWVVPKAYVEKVGDEGFKKAPIGAGPYKFVSFNPGIELVMEAFDQYWRKPPNVKRLIFKVIPDETTRLAALKRGEVARLAARRTRSSCQGDFGSHWSGKYRQNVPWTTAGLRVSPGVR
jgi:peptide/nickel transport system substrate-binding protein